MYIERQLEKKFIAVNEEYACVLLTGPRQVGKSTMLRHLMEGTARAEVSLDDLEERRLAKTDPAMFLKLHPAPVLIDEVQYAPELFSYIKIAVDNGAAPGSYWLTGSQAYRLMELAQESLAGRTAILHMSAPVVSILYSPLLLWFIFRSLTEPVFIFKLLTAVSCSGDVGLLPFTSS